MKMKRNSKGSLLVRNLTVTILASVMVLSFALIIINGNINSSVQYTTLSHLDSFKSSVTEFVSLLNRFDYLVENNSRIQQVFTEESNGTIVLKHETELQAILENMEGRLSNGVKVLAYIRGDKMIYSSDGTEQYGQYQQMLSKDYLPDESQLFTAMLTARTATLLRLLHISDVQKDTLLYLSPVSVTDRKEAGVVFLFLMDSGEVKSIFERYLGDGFGCVTVYSPSSLNVFYVSASSPVNLKTIIKHPGTGSMTFKENGNVYVLLRIINGERNVSVTLLDSQEHFYQSVDPIKATQTIFFCVMALLLMTLAVFVSLTNALPIHKYVSELSGVHKLSTRDNELEYLKNYHNRLSEENHLLFTKLGEVTIYAVSHLVRRLVFGKIKTKDELDYFLSCAGISFPYPNYCAFYILPGISPQTDDQNDVSVCLTKPQEALILPGELLYENALTVLVNFPAMDDPLAFVRALAEQWLSILHQKGYSDANIGIGMIVQEPLKLAESFSQASAIVRLCNADSNGVLMMKQKENNEWHEDQLIALTVESVRRMKAEEACHYWQTLLSNLSASSESVLMFKYRFSGILKEFHQKMEQMDIVVSTETIERITAATNIKDILRKSEVMLTSCVIEAERLNTQQQLSQHRSVMTYIREHFMDYEMSMQTASKALGMQPAQINEILHKDVDMYFVQYIAFLRMEEFKKRLRTGNETIQVLVHEIGYSNAPSFLRKFKLQEGMTPSEYRAQVREQKQMGRSE